VARRGGRLIIVNRTADRARALAGEFGGHGFDLAEAASRDWDILVNTTPVGMSPVNDLSPVPAHWLHPGRVVMDIVYNPLETRLLKEAAGRGCRIIDGLAMFVYQGACQFEAWTGLPAPLEIMRRAALRALQNPHGNEG